jgi:2-oxoisovalerate dehydrogenase E1 component beta subunit
MEPKAMYRASTGNVPVGDYQLPLGKGEIVQAGTDITLVGWGAQMRVLQEAADLARDQLGVSVELIDLRTLLPWDVDLVEASVKKTGRCIVSHEAPITSGFGAEIVASIQERCFLHLESPCLRVCGYDTPFPLIFEKLYLPDVWKNFEAIKKSTKF